MEEIWDRRERARSSLAGPGIYEGFGALPNEIWILIAEKVSHLELLSSLLYAVGISIY